LNIREIYDISELNTSSSHAINMIYNTCGAIMGLANCSLDAVNKNETHYKSKYKEKKAF